MNKLKLQWCLKLELLNGALGFSKSGLELELVHLNVFSLGNTLSLVLASPHIRLLVSLVDLSQEITLDASLFLQMVLDTIKLMFEVLEFAKKGSPLLCFVISNMSSLTQLGFKLDLQFGHHVGLVLKFLDLFQQVSVFSGNLPLVVFKVSKSKVGLFNLLVSFIERSKQALVGFLSRSLGSANLISGSTNILDLMHESGFLLLNLGLHLGKLVNLFRHLSNSILMLLLQADEGGGLLDVGFFQILPQLTILSLSLLVELNLSVGCTSSLIESLTKALKLLSKIRPLPLSLGPGLPLSFQFFFQFFYSRLDLLDGFLDLANKLLLIVQFAGKTSEVLFLPLDGTLCLLLLPLQLRDGFLGYLEVTFNPPPGLLNIGTSPLLSVQAALQLIQSSFKLSLDLGQMINLVLRSCKILKALCSILADMLLLLVQLLDNNIVSLKGLLVQSSLLSGCLHVNQLVASINQTSFQLSLSDISSSLTVGVLAQVALLRLQLSQQSLLLCLHLNIFLFHSCLGVDLFLISTISFLCLSFQNG